MTNLELLMEYMEQNQYFIGNDLLAKYNELLQKEKQEQLRIADVSSMFSAKQMEQAFNDGIEAERCGELDIENYC
jgi:hypothetical protein